MLTVVKSRISGNFYFFHTFIQFINILHSTLEEEYGWKWIISKQSKAISIPGFKKERGDKEISIYWKSLLSAKFQPRTLNKELVTFSNKKI